MTITGSGFTGTTAVDFGSTRAASFTVIDDTSITAVSPAGTARIVDITVYQPHRHKRHGPRSTSLPIQSASSTPAFTVSSSQTIGV